MTLHTAVSSLHSRFFWLNMRGLQRALCSVDFYTCDSYTRPVQQSCKINSTIWMCQVVGARNMHCHSHYLDSLVFDFQKNAFGLKNVDATGRYG